MNNKILGIDLGTSSVKLIVWDGKDVFKAKAAYGEISPKGWTDALKRAASELDLQNVCAIGLSSQVGTYIINDSDVISWNDTAGGEELEYIKKKYSTDKFVEEIAMPHPDLISYPIPRLMYILKHYGQVQSVCQPKDYILRLLTGSCVTDRYSMRGLIHTRKGDYSSFFLNELGIERSALPKVTEPDALVGITTKECFEMTSIPEGIKVYAGLNDFFSSLVGMGIEESGQMFDITGTSEHLGYICDELCKDTKMVSGVYFDGFIHYGVTGSSGASLDFGIRELGFDNVNIQKSLENNAPVFLPYLNGERAPIYDSNAKGVFFGINGKTTRADMAYAVLEGVAMSIYHIYDRMGKPESHSITVSGGASRNSILNTIKAELFGKKIYTLTENDTSALGAVQLAALASGLIKKGERINSVSHCIEPTGRYKQVLLQRYEQYKKLYPALKEQF